jgi:hypothetical protein
MVEEVETSGGEVVMNSMQLFDALWGRAKPQVT